MTKTPDRNYRRDKTCFNSVSEGSVQWGRHGGEAQRVPWCSRSQEKGMGILTSFFTYYFIWEPIPCDGAVRILGKSSTSVSAHWKRLPTYTQRCASTSLMTLNAVKLIAKTGHINKDMNACTCLHEHAHGNKLIYSKPGIHSPSDV